LYELPPALAGEGKNIPLSALAKIVVLLKNDIFKSIFWIRMRRRLLVVGWELMVVGCRLKVDGCQKPEDQILRVN